ncbi:triple tyrosine motif-containing protein [Mesonia sp.]|uniref:helix-turn-helix and ligand-binding sensor domain-containing protein n=1 Tax=Mesonia sp. TaxID=1960830 RepID=UPI001774DF94|nr:triple tyrosine motif-containing protein [Mesonia sp.]HIB36004.1 hypothetical protein [Mesonia sp.]HIO26321.1 hypothetical protein [Flavobacteriaceae bacterium]
MRLFFYFLIGFCFAAQAQQTTPFFKNYSKKDYLGENANWDITQNEQGILFAANNYKLLEFNGNDWRKYSLPKNLVIRSSEVINDTLFTGAYQEFGYWIYNNKNELEYTSLSEKLDVEFFKNDAIWKIYSFDNQIVFQSFKGIYLFDLKTKDISKIAFPEVSAIFTYNFNETIYLTSKNGGIFKLVEDKFVFETWSEPLKAFTIQSMAPFGDGFLLGTQLNGIFLYKNNRLSPWLSKDAATINGIEINNLSVIDQKLCIGTINNGLLILDQQKELLYTINTNNGLLNNTVLSQYEDTSGNLWLGLDNGIACIYLSSPLYSFNDKSGKLGTLYAVEKDKNDPEIEYLGSNHGVFKKENGTLSFIEDSNGQVWNLTQIGNEIICGHNNETFSIKNSRLEQLTSISGGTRMVKTNNPNEFIQGNYSGLTKFIRNKDGWQTQHLENIYHRVNELAIDKKENFWIVSPHNGVYQLQQEKNNTLKQLKFYPEEQFKHIFEVNDEIFLAGNDEIFKYDIINDTILEDKILTEKLMPLDHVMAFQDKYIVTKNAGNVNILNLSTNEVLKLSSATTENKLVQDFDFAKAINDAIYLFLDDGYLVVDMNSEIEVQENKAPIIASLMINGETKKIDSLYEIPYKKNSIEINLTNLKPANYLQHQFQYKLKGYDNNWYFTNENTISFENLPRGNYRLLVKNVSGNQESKTLVYDFIVLAPWYFSNEAILGYVLFVLLVFYLIHFFNKRRYKIKQRRFEKEIAYQNRLQLQQEKIENNKRLADLEKKQLKDQLDSKRRELATYAASMAKKEEILSQLEKEINKEEIKKEHSKLYDRLNKFKEKQSHSEDDWKLFERNFNEVHDDFFKNLQQEYPELTPKDLKLCAYLKMNLSSKEIAPLIGITYRSVELHRYRLRKKLDLDKKENLVKFLLSFD